MTKIWFFCKGKSSKQSKRQHLKTIKNPNKTKNSKNPIQNTPNKPKLLLVSKKNGRYKRNWLNRNFSKDISIGSKSWRFNYKSRENSLNKDSTNTKINKINFKATHPLAAKFLTIITWSKNWITLRSNWKRSKWWLSKCKNRIKISIKKFLISNNKYRALSSKWKIGSGKSWSTIRVPKAKMTHKQIIISSRSRKIYTPFFRRQPGSSSRVSCKEVIKCSPTKGKYRNLRMRTWN